jgi:hypothetical protein
MEIDGYSDDTLMGCVIQCIGRGFEQSALRPVRLTYLEISPIPPIALLSRKLTME